MFSKQILGLCTTIALAISRKTRLEKFSRKGPDFSWYTGKKDTGGAGTHMVPPGVRFIGYRTFVSNFQSPLSLSTSAPVYGDASAVGRMHCKPVSVAARTSPEVAHATA